MTTVTEVLPIGRRLRDLAGTYGDAPAVTAVRLDGTERTLSWQELDLQSNQLARVFDDRGIGSGDRVAIEMPNSVELVLCVLAAWKVGGVPITMRWDLPEWERSRLLDVVAGRLVVCRDDLDELTAAASKQSSDPLPDVIGPQLLKAVS